MLHGSEKSAVLGKLFVSWLAVTLHAAWWIGTGKEKARYGERYTEANTIYMQARFVCDGILDECANGEIHVRGCSQSLRVRQFFGNVEGSGSTINLSDRGGEKCKMNEQH